MRMVHFWLKSILVEKWFYTVIYQQCQGNIEILVFLKFVSGTHLIQSVIKFEWIYSHHIFTAVHDHIDNPFLDICK